MANNVTDLGKVGITMKGDWSSSTAYERLDGVMYDGSLWIALANNTNSTPAINNSNWMLSAKHGEFTEQQLEEFKEEVVADSKEEMDDYTDDKKGELDTYTNTKKSDLNTYTGTKQTELNTYTNTKKIDLDNYTNGKKGELDNYTNNLKSDFDSNATSKTATFNTNASDKTTAFNTNASDKTTAFNANASDKTTAFDSHVTSETSDFDEHVTSETSDFDEHAAEKIEEYDEHIVDFQAQIDDLTTEVEELAGNMPWDSIEQTTSISITDAAKYSRNKMELFGNSEQATSLLPEGYTQLEYIESTGTQYIDTGRLSTPNTKFEMDYLSNKQRGSVFQCLFGSQNATDQKRVYMLLGTDNIIAIHFPYSFGNNVLYMKSDGTFSSSSLEDIVKFNYGEKNKVIFDIPNKTLSVGQYTSVSTSTDELLDSGHNILIFGRNDNTIPTSNFATGKLYRFKWYENNVLTMDFIPCINTNNEVGMYDTVTKTFFGNAGTGTFVASAVLPEGYTQLEYIVNTGTQYIDTGLIGTDLTDSEIELTIKNNTTGLIQYNFNGAYQTGKAAQMGTVATSDTTCRASINFGFTDAIGTDGLDITQFHKLYAKDGLQKIDGAQVGTNSFGSLNEYSFLLFARTNAGTTNINPGSSISSFTVKKNGTYIRNLIPCINTNNEAGMYDTVGETFYGNAGIGSFIAGNVITKLTPSPEYPSDIHVVKGNNTININDTVYSFNIGNTEFCKVKTYQDYFFKDNGTWYKKQIIEKYVYNNDLATNTTTDTYVMMSTPALNIAADLSQQQLANIAMCNVMESKPVVYTGLNGTTATKKIRLMLSKQYASNYDEAKALYADKGLTIYYVAETPTNVEITDTTLIATLESIYQLSLAKGTNTITITATDLAPFMTLNYMQDLPSKLESIESRITLLED